MKKLIFSMLAALVSVFFASATTPYIPDFAYPQDVINHSEKDINIALSTQNDTMLISGMVQYAIAESNISDDNFSTVVAKIDSALSLTASRPVINAILLSVKAQFFIAYYNNNSYSFRSRTASTGTLPDDVNEWSAAQMQDYVVGLLNKSLENKDALLSEPLTSLGSTVEYNEWGLKICPDVYRFLLNRAYDNYGLLIRGNDNPYLKQLIDVNNGTNDFAFLYYVSLDFQNNKPINNLGSNFDEWKKIYDQYSGTQYSGFLFCAFYNSSISMHKKEAVKIYKLILDFQARYPDYPFMGTLDDIINNITAHDVMCSIRKTIAPNTPAKIYVTSENVNDISICVYRCPNSVDNYKLKDCKLVHTITATFTDTIPFYNTQHVDLPPLDYGKYAMVIKPKDSSLNKESRMEEFYVTDIQLVNVESSNQSEATFMAVNGFTGKPMRDVTIKQYENIRGNKKLVASKRTDKDFYAKFPCKSNNEYHYYASYKNDKYGIGYQNYFYSDNKVTTDTMVLVNTDLGVYRPGATLKFVINAYSSNSQNSTQTLLSDTKFRCVIFNASWSPIDTLTLTTDSWGRAAAEYVLPKGSMNGQFSIRVLNGSGNRNLGIKSFRVAEYKMPTFFIEFDKTPDYYPADIDTVTISGKVCTYSGVPLANSIVKGELNIYNIQRYSFDSTKNPYLETRTNSLGQFSYKIPMSEFHKLDSISSSDGTRLYYITYGFNASCTSQSGESQSCSFTFAINKLLSVIFDKTDIIASSATVLPITINSHGYADSDSLYYELTPNNSDSKTSYKGYFKISDKVINLFEVPSGEYTLYIMRSTNENDGSNRERVVIYRPDENESPVKSMLWVPVKSLKQSADGSVSFIAASNTYTYIYYIAYNSDGVVAKGWINMPEGQHNLKIALPKSLNQKVNIKLHTVKKFNPTDISLSVEPYIEPESISLTIESFRDKATAGDNEHWRLKITDQKGNPVEGALILDIYNAALDAISRNNFYLYFQRNNSFYASIRSNSTFNIVPNLRWKDKNPYSDNPIMLPILNTYGIYIFSTAQQLRMNKQVFTVKGVGGLYQENTVYYRAANTKAAAVQDLAESIEEEADAGTPQESENNSIQLRSGDLTNALWMPYLTTDASGVAAVEFTIPNYNTELVLRALAYNKNLCNSSLSKGIVVSKPIMVQPNLPRFLRNGDDASISSLIINNSDTEQQVNVNVEIYNPHDNTIYLTDNKTVTLAAGENKPYSVSYKVPAEISLMGYRIIASNSKYSDGEQNVVPVLEAVSPIVESQTFYLNPGEKSASFALRDYPANSRITLSYCDNPAWLCITALPAIFNKSSVTATSLAYTLFSAFTARGIANQFKSIDEAVTYWQYHPQDSMLVSMLQKNSDLKIGSLENSPWVTAAASQTLQMQSISKLLDKQYIDDITAETISSLKELQNSNGSFSWFRNCPDSYYMTMQVLRLLGEINEMSYLPSDNQELNSIISKAINYVDSEVINIYNTQKNKKDYSVFQDFAYIRSMFPDFGLSRTLQELTNKGISQALSSWKSKSLTSKAQLIILLCRNGKRSDALPVYKSLLQYAIHTKDKGTYWDKLGCNSLSSTALMLTAIKAVDSGALIIDEVRQWLLIQKQTNLWNASDDAAKAVYALLSSGTDWMQPASGSDFSISIGSENVSKQGIEKFTGSLLRDIHINSQASTLSVSRSGDSPAWGAVIARYAAPMATVRAADIAGLSISKKLYDVNGNLLSAAKSFRVGDKVRVMLTVKNKQSMDYVTIHDERAAAMEPVNQVSGYTSENNVFMYREIKDDCVNLFISHLPKGTHTLYYDATITAPGTYSAGVASVQSQYAPDQVAHSEGIVINTISSPSATE